MKAVIFDIARGSYADGPGIRTTVFFKGCNLKCAWCHNPESQRAEREILFYKSKCTGCGGCKALTVKDEAFLCFHGAKELCGKEYSVAEVMKETVKDQAFYEGSGGGVTFSGGECMLQIDFLEEILRECKKNGIHTAVDTAGHLLFERFERILPYTDLFLYDVKCYDSEKHKAYTGASNELILSNLNRLLQAGKSVWVRIPIIPTVNDTEEELQSIKEYIFSCGKPERVELLPYHAMGEHKYEALGRQATPFSVPSEEKMKHLKNLFL